MTPRHLPARAGELDVDPADAGWAYARLRILHLGPGERRGIATGDEEVIVLPLAGACEVRCGPEAFGLAGRRSVFSRVSDFAYLPRDADAEVVSADGGRFALASARCDQRLEPRSVKAEDVPVEIRGAGSCSRQVNNFAAAGSFPASRLIAVEVLTPAGNWSSYPPHKHDEEIAGTENVLEEIYYYEIGRDGYPGLAPGGVAYQRVYGTAGRPADLLAEVRTGDVITIPHGWHGPAMTPPGYQLYYLNVMAGPGERAWLARDDPAYAWIRDTWPTQQPDPRLPLTTATEREG